MVKRAHLLAAIALLVVCSIPALAAVTGGPALSITVTEERIEAGETATLQVSVQNSGAVESGSASNPGLHDEVTTARGVTLSLDNGSVPFDVRTRRQAFGAVPVGLSDPVDVIVAVPPDADPGRYTIDGTLDYEYTDYISESGGGWSTTEADTDVRIRVVVPARASVAVRDIDSTVTEDDAGTVAVTVENDGTLTARDVRFALTSASPHLTVDGADTGTRTVERLPPNRSVQLSYRVGPTEGTARTNYSMSLATEYETAWGTDRVAPPVWFSVTPGTGVNAAIETTAVELPTGAEGAITGSVTLTGDRPANDAVLLVESVPGGVAVTDGRIPLGDVAAGATSEFSIPVTVSPTARAGSRSLSATLEYRDANGQRRTTVPDSLSVTVTDRERVAVRAINGTIAPDAETRQVIEIENLGETPLYDVTAAIRPTPPFTSGSPTGYVSQLDPGETTTVAVHLETSGDAVLGTRSLPVNVTAEDGDGNRIATGPQGVEIEVATPAGQTDDITLFAVGVVVVVLILAAGWWWLRQ